MTPNQQTLSGEKRREPETSSSTGSSSGSSRVEETQLAVCVGGTPELVPDSQESEKDDVIAFGTTRLDLLQQDSEEAHNMENQPCTKYKLRTLFRVEERELLRSVVNDYGVQQVRLGNKVWENKELWISIWRKYNDELKVNPNPSMETMKYLQIISMAESMNWCVCTKGSKELCQCVIPRVPQTTVAETSLSLTNNSVKQFSGSGNSRKRSYDSFISEGLIERVASHMFQLVVSGQMAYEEAQHNNEIYSAMINHGLHVNVQMMCKIAETGMSEDLLSCIESDKKMYGYLRGA